MTKRLEELNNNELKIVFYTNEELQQEVLEDMIENEMQWITNDYLPYIQPSLESWSIGYCDSNYISVRDSVSFIEGVKELQKDYCFLADKENVFIENIESKLNELYLKEKYTNEHDNLEDEINEDIELLARKIVEQFDLQFEWISKHESQFEYFLEFYLDSRMNLENFYVDENYNLYENISYVKHYS